jgi:hypothetical protein
MIAFVIIALLLLGKDPFTGIYGLLVLGGLQIISMVVHFFLKPPIWKSKRRKIYYVLCALCLLLMAVTVFTKLIENDIAIMAWMIPVTGGVAIYYMIVCLLEIKKLQSQ